MDISIQQVLAVKEMILDSIVMVDSLAHRVPKGFPGAREDWIRQEKIYGFLEKSEKAIPFHSGEIWQILVTGLEFGQGDFEKTLRFIINYFRDNDTVGAVAGMILGAKDDFSKLPDDLRTETLRVDKEVLGIDPEALAHKMVKDLD